MAKINIFENPTAKDLWILNRWIDTMTTSFISSEKITKIEKQERASAGWFLSISRCYHTSAIQQISQPIPKAINGQPKVFWDEFGGYYSSYENIKENIDLLGEAFKEYINYMEYDNDDDFIKEMKKMTKRLKKDFQKFIF